MVVRLRKVALHAWLWTLAVLLALIVLVVVTSGFVLGTERGRLFLLEQAELWVPRLTGQTLVIEEASVPNLGDWRLGRVEWRAGESGPGVVLNDARLQFRPRYLFQRRLWVDALTASSVRVDIPENTSTEPAPTGDSSFSLPQLQALWPRIPPIRLEQLQVDRLALDLPGRSPLETSIDGDAQLNWGSWPARLNLALRQGEHSDLTLAVAVDAVNSLRVTGDVRAPADSDWAQWLDWPLEDALAGQWDMELRTADAGYEADIRDLILPWREYQLSANGSVSVDRSFNRVFLSELSLAVDGHSARVHGFLEAHRSDLTVRFDDMPLGLANGLIPVEGLDGSLAANGRMTGGWRAPRFEGEAAFDGQLQGESVTLETRSRATTDGVKLETAELAWGEARLSASGAIQWTDRRIDLDLNWRNVVDSRWQPWVPGWPSDLSLRTSGEGRLSGALSAPTLEASVQVDGQYREQPLSLTSAVLLTRRDLELNGLALTTEQGRIDGHAELTFADLAFTAGTRLDNVRSRWLDAVGIELPVEQDWGVTGELDWSGTLTDPRAEGDLNVVGQWQQQPMNAQLRLDELTVRHLRLGESHLTLSEAQTRVSGRVDWQQQHLDLRATLQQLRLRQVRPFLPALPAWLDDLRGGTSGDVTVAGPWTAPSVTGDLVFEGEWQERALRLDLNVSAPERERWQVRNAKLKWGELSADFKGDLRPFEPALDGRFNIAGLKPSDLSVLPVNLPATVSEFSGQARASGTISGSLTAPTLTGTVGFDGQWQGTDLKLDGEIQHLDPQRVQLEGVTLRSGKTRLTARGSVGLDPLSFDLHTELTDLSWQQLKPWVPEPEGVPLDTLSANASGELTLTGKWPHPQVDGHLNARGDYLNQSFQVDWRGQGGLASALTHRVEMNWGEADLTADLDTEGDTLDGLLRLSNFNVAQMRALGVPLGLQLTGQASADVQITGAIADPAIDATVSAGGTWRPPSAVFASDTAWNIDVKADGRLDDWRIERGQADLGPAGQVSVQGSGTLNSIDLTVDLDAPELRYWLPEESRWIGSLRGQLSVAGTPDAPDVSADLEWDSARWPLAMTVMAQTDQGRHRLQARLTEDGAERLSVDVSTAQTALSAWREDLSQRRFEADASIDTDAESLSLLLQQSAEQDFRGDISGRLSIVGSLAKPEWEGEARFRNGRYENANYGTVLSDISASLTANNRTLELSLDAGDDGGGRVNLGGTVNWPEDRTEWWMPELDLSLDTRNAHLVRRADIDATVNGGLTIDGPWRDLTVAGDLEVMPLTIKLTSFLQSGVPTLNVVRTSAETVPDPSVRATPYAPDGQWQVRIRVDRRAQIYGQGLEAELGGEIDLTDSLTSPEVGGRFEVIRGTYTAFGKIFQIESGTVQVQGSQIMLDIDAVYESPELTVDLRITGNQDRLELTMTSESPLSNDELLARLLFGKRIEEMTAVQALQLASALNSLRNPGSGLDLFGTTRELLGLDALTIDSGTNEAGETGVNVQAGKYLSDRLYLQVESGVRTDETFSSRLQYQVTPNVNFEFYTQGEIGSGGVELNWKNDY